MCWIHRVAPAFIPQIVTVNSASPAGDFKAQSQRGQHRRVWGPRPFPRWEPAYTDLNNLIEKPGNYSLYSTLWEAIELGNAARRGRAHTLTMTVLVLQELSHLVDDFFLLLSSQSSSSRGNKKCICLYTFYNFSF